MSYQQLAIAIGALLFVLFVVWIQTTPTRRHARAVRRHRRQRLQALAAAHHRVEARRRSSDVRSDHP